MAYSTSQSQQDLVAALIKGNALKTSQIIEAFKVIDRRDFVLEPFTDEAYENSPISIGHGQTISQPWTVAFMLELLAPQPGERILDIGSGSGWTTALLAQIVSANKTNKTGKVFALELIPELCVFGEQNCAKYNFVESGRIEFHCQDATPGLALAAPFDRILCSAALPAQAGLPTDILPLAWKEQLRVGGRLVVPVKNSIFVFDKVSEKDFLPQEHEGFAFVPFVQD